jgi:hypothetical protein
MREVFYSLPPQNNGSPGAQWQIITPPNQQLVFLKWLWVDAYNSSSYALQTVGTLTENDGAGFDGILDDNGAGTLTGNGLRLFCSDRSPFMGYVPLKQGSLYYLDASCSIITGLPATGDYTVFAQMILCFE